jgi:hypothetical protein
MRTVVLASRSAVIMGHQTSDAARFPFLPISPLKRPTSWPSTYVANSQPHPMTNIGRVIADGLLAQHRQLV